MQINKQINETASPKLCGAGGTDPARPAARAREAAGAAVRLPGAQCPSPAGWQLRRPYLLPTNPGPAEIQGTRSCPFQITPQRLAVPTETQRPFKRGSREAQQEARPLPSLGDGARPGRKQKVAPRYLSPQVRAQTHFQTAPQTNPIIRRCPPGAWGSKSQPSMPPGRKKNHSSIKKSSRKWEWGGDGRA